MHNEETEREQVIGKLSDEMDPDGAAAMVARLVLEARAEFAMELRRIAGEAFAAWDADKDMRVGKMLRALAGESPGYRADIDVLLGTRPVRRWTVQPPCDVGRVAPVEVHSPCLYCQVKPCKDIYPTDTDRWCGFCSGTTSGLVEITRGARD